MIFSIVSRNEIDVFQTIIIMYRVRVVEFLVLGVGPNHKPEENLLKNKNLYFPCAQSL